MANDSTANENTSMVNYGGDRTSPYSYREWSNAGGFVSNLSDLDEYSKYVLGWRESKDSEVDVKRRILNDYVTFVRSVYPYIENSDTFDVKDLDLDSSLSLELLIPEFVRRIKSIMLYFIEKRISIMRAKLKYSMHGTYLSIERMLHEWLLSDYTIRKHHVPNVRSAIPGVTIPKLDDVKNSLRVRVDEYYDDQNYADKNPSHGAASYFTDIEGYVTSGDSELANSLYGDWSNGNGGTDIVWLFDGGLNERKLDNPIYYSVRDAVLGTSSLEEYEAEKLANRYVFDLTRKYIGNDYGYISGGFYKEDWRDFEYLFRRGNNYFYFPSGGQDYQPADLQINPVNINYTTISANAHAGDTYEESDRIFIRKNGNVKGAWLKKLQKDWTDHDMVVSVPMKLGYSFMFPLAGYGTSGDGIPWSGPIYDSTHPLYMSLDESEKEVIKAAYWNNPPSGYLCESMSVQKFNIADMDESILKYIAGSAFLDSMHMSVVPSSSRGKMSESVYRGDVNQMWLYRPQTTEFVVDDCKNYYEFPYFTLTSKDERSSFSDIRWCDDVPLSSIGTASAFRGGVGGNCPANSDILYKVDANGRPVEAAWLSAMPVEYLYFTSADHPMNSRDWWNEVTNAQEAYRDEMAKIDQWKGLEFISKYSFVFPTQSHGDYRCVVSGLFQRYEYGFSVNPGEDEYFMYTGWSPYDKRDVFGSYVPGGPFVSALFLGESPRPEFATVPYTEGCEDYDYIYSCANYPYVDSVEDRKANAIFFSGGRWMSRTSGQMTTAAFQDYTDYGEPVIVKNMLYKYHRSSTATAPGVFRIINEAFSEGPFSAASAARELIPAEYTRWIKMTRDLYTGEWISDMNYAPSDMILRSGDVLVYDSVKTSRVVVEMPYLEYPDYAFDLTTIPYVARIGLQNARPYWAEAVNDDSDETGLKAIDVHSNGIRWVSNCFLLNPDISNAVVGPLDRISLYSDRPFVWRQTISVKEKHDEAAWYKLKVDYHDVDLSSVYGNDHVVRDWYDRYVDAKDAKRSMYQPGVISAIPTDEISDIDFEYTDGDQILVNYWANDEFVWKQRFLNVKNGVPPTGGIYVPYEMTESGVEAIVPWANLSNRHYPSMAVAPDLSRFYRKEDVGGYFTPQYMGVSEAVTKDPILYVDVSKRTDAENAIDPITVGETFAQDDGFTNGRENPAIYVKNERMDWAKIPIGLGANAGMRQDNGLSQSFIPYMTQEEGRGGRYDIGVHRPDDPTDPFKNDGTYDWDKLGAGRGYDEHFTRQQPIRRWAEDRFVNHEVTVVKTDVYGFSYILLKDIEDGDCIYEQRERRGFVYYRGSDPTVRNIYDLSDKFSKHPIMRCGLITDLDVNHDILYAAGCLPEDPISEIRNDSGILDTWSDWFSSPDNFVEGSVPGSITPYLIYTQDEDSYSVKSSDGSSILDSIRPIFKVCLRKFIYETMDRLAATYHIDEFRLVGDGCDNPYETFNSISDAIERLYDSIREHFADVIYALPIDDVFYPWKKKDENGVTVDDMLNDILLAMEEQYDDPEFEPHPKDTPYGMMWHLIEVCRRIMQFHLFSENMRAYFMFPIDLVDDGDTPYIGTRPDKIIIREENVRTKFTRPWYLPQDKKYLIPMVSLDANGLLSAAVDEVDTVVMGEPGISRFGIADDYVCSSVTSAVSGALSATINGDWMIQPVAAYNDKTNNLEMVQQISGTNSEIGAFALFNYNFITKEINSGAILPCDMRGEFEKYIEEMEHKDEEEEKPEYDLGNKISFVDGGKYKYSFWVYDYADGNKKVYSDWSNGSTEASGSELLAKYIPSGGVCTPVDGDTIVIKNGAEVRLNNYYSQYYLLGVYKDESNSELFDFDLPIKSDTTAYIGWENDVEGISLSNSEFGTISVVYSDSNTPLFKQMSLYENLNRIVEIPHDVNLYKRAEILRKTKLAPDAWADDNNASASGYLMPSFACSVSDGYRVRGYEIWSGGNEIASIDMNSSLDTSVSAAEVVEFVSHLKGGCELRLETERIEKKINRLILSNAGGIDEETYQIPYGASSVVPAVGMNDMLGVRVNITRQSDAMLTQTIYFVIGNEDVCIYSRNNISNYYPIYDKVDIMCGEYTEMFRFDGLNMSNIVNVTSAGSNYTGKRVRTFEGNSNEEKFDISNWALSNDEIYVRIFKNEEII